MSEGEAKMTDSPNEIKLSSGRTAMVRKGLRARLMRLHRVAGHNPEPTAVTFALIAELAQVDGKPIVYEDVLAINIGDVLRLEAEIVRGSKRPKIFR